MPAFYVIKFEFDRQDNWLFPEIFAERISGPLTVSIININLIGPERSFHAARKFERAMKDGGIPHHVSTRFIIPGLMASVTSAEPTDPFQVLISSQSFDREPVANPEFGEVRE